jgi:hypothetical protein
MEDHDGTSSHTLSLFSYYVCYLNRSDSIVPTIATELIVGALLVVVVMFWTTLDLGQRHDDIPKMANYQEYLGILKEKGYLLSLFQGGNSNI